MSDELWGSDKLVALNNPLVRNLILSLIVLIPEEVISIFPGNPRYRKKVLPKRKWKALVLLPLVPLLDLVEDLRGR